MLNCLMQRLHSISLKIILAILYTEQKYKSVILFQISVFWHNTSLSGHSEWLTPSGSLAS